MVAGNAPLGLASLVLLAGSIVLIFFVILPGVKDTAPLNKTYFLQADTSGISGARALSQWTYFYVCGEDNTDCSKAYAAMPFRTPWDGDASGVPDGLNSNYYYLMWRFGWVFYLIALFFDVCAFFAGFLACCGRLGAALSGLVALTALVFYSAAVALMTATFVKARNAFQADGHDAKIGVYAMGFSWGAWGAIFLAVILFFIGTRGNHDAGGGRRGWRRRRSVRSRHSYDVGGRRVKDDYS